MLSIIYYLIGFLSLIGIFFGLGLKPNNFRERVRLNQRIRLNRYTENLLANPYLKKYHLILSITFKRYTADSFVKILTIHVFSFLILMVLIFIITRAFIVSFASAIIFAFAIPITLFYLRHKTIQNHIQHEILDVAIILLQEYQKNRHHMLYALKEVVNRTTGKVEETYARLFARMQLDDETKKEAAELFSFQIGQDRGKNLSTIILRACKDGTNVKNMLEELVEDITEFNKRKRTGVTKTRDTALVGWFPLVSLTGLVIFNQTTLIPNGKAFYYQFQTPTGLKSFIFAAICSVIGIIMFIVLRNPKKE